MAWVGWMQDFRQLAIVPDKEGRKLVCHTFIEWRRGRDSNPRNPFGVYAISSRAPSATRPPLRRGDSTRFTCFYCISHDVFRMSYIVYRKISSFVFYTIVIRHTNYDIRHSIYPSLASRFSSASINRSKSPSSTPCVSLVS